MWYNPQGIAELTLPGESDVEAWLRKELLREKNVGNWAQLAWELCPAAAIFLQGRYVHNPLMSLPFLYAP